MVVQPENAAEEIKRLRRCINDLMGVLALPAVWVGGSPAHIVGNLLDALVSVLDLDFIYARFGNSGDSEVTEMVRIVSAVDPKPRPQEITEGLRLWLRDSSQDASQVVSNFCDGWDMALASMKLGLHGEMGLLVAASARLDFPQQTERLILNVAANQAAVGLQEAYLLGALDQRVAQRTRELTSANEQLQEARAALERAFGEIKRSEAKLGRVIDTIPTIAWCNLPNGPNEFLNKSWHEYTGLSPEESHGWGWQVAFHAEDLPALLTRWQQMLVTGEPGEIEARIRRRDGVYRWFLIRAEPFFEEGKLVRWYGTSTDIHDRKRAEEALVESAYESRLIVDTIPGLVGILNASGEVEFVSQPLLDYYGKSLEELSRWAENDTIYEEDRPAVAQALANSLPSGNPLNFEARFRRFDGVYRWFQVLGRPLRDRHGDIARWYLLQTDVDERRYAEEAINKARSELAHVARVSALSALTASIAHEVNQPLSGIVTNAGTCLRMLDANPPNLEGARETARRTIRDGNRASEVVARLRALFSNKGGATATEPVDLSEAAREVLALSLNELHRNRVILRPELAENLPPVTGVRVQLQQVILNLLRNATDAMSSVEDRPRQLLIRTEPDGDDRVRLTVRDSGIGFAPQAADKLFEAFYSTKSDGMGVGLYVSRSIIESHQGRLWAAPNDGPGATFCVSIPCRKKNVTEARSAGAG